MAELVVGGETRLPLDGKSVLIGRRSDDGTFRPDVDLAGLEGGRTISRRHARIYDRDGQWYLRVESSTTNSTVVAGQPLAAGQEVRLNDGDEIQLGKVLVVFRAESAPAAPNGIAVGTVEAPAELVGDGQTFALSAPEGRELTIGRHSDDGTIRPDIDLGDLPSGRTVSRRHGLLYNRAGQWYLRVEAEVTNPTLLDGRRLERGEEAPLSEGNRLQLGRVIVTFHQLRRIENVGPELIELSVEPAETSVEPGAEVEATVTVVNHTGHVDWFRVEVAGVPPTWYRILLPDGSVAEPAQVRLFHTPAHATPTPDAIAQLKLVYAPPRDSESRAGAYPLVVSATTQGEPQMRRAATAALTVERFEQLSVELEPEEIAGPTGEFTVALHNAGNDVASVILTPEGDGLVYQWDRPALNPAPAGEPASKVDRLRQQPLAQQVPLVGKPSEAPAEELPRVQVPLGNGARDAARLVVKARRRHWLGMDRIYTYSVTAQAGGEEVMRRARLVCPPRVPLWLQSAYRRVQSALVPVLMLVALLGFAFAFGRPPDIKDFKAEPASVVVGTPVSLTWSLDRAAGVTIEPSSGTEQLTVPEGSLAVAPAASTRYTLTARNRLGITSSRSVSVEVKPAPQLPKILSFTASTERLKKEGEAVTLRWETDGATKVTIEPADEIKDPKPSGEATVHPGQGSTTYKLVATNAAGSKEATKTLVIDPPQVASFTAGPESVVQGGEVRLRWSAQNATKLTLKASKGEIAEGKAEVEVPAGATDQVVRPLEDTEYTLTAANAGGADVKTVKVTVSPMQVVFFKAEPATIAKGEQTQLSWNVVGASSITIQPDIGAVAPGETSRLVKPGQTTEYTLTATGADGKQVEQKVAVTVGLGAVKVDFFTAAPPAVVKGESATLTYSVQNAKRVTIKASDGRVLKDGAVGQPSVSESLAVTPDKTTTYTLTATNDSGQTAASATVEVRSPTPVPTPAPPPPAQPAPPQP